MKDTYPRCNRNIKSSCSTKETLTLGSRRKCMSVNGYERKRNTHTHTQCWPMFIDGAVNKKLAVREEALIL